MGGNRIHTHYDMDSNRKIIKKNNMSYIRTKGELSVTFYKGEQGNHQFDNQNEWVDEKQNLGLGDDTECRIDLTSWQDRYEYEKGILAGIITDNSYKKIIELGSGPGQLGEMVMKDVEGLDWSFIDQRGAQQIHQQRGFGGRFFVKDLQNGFDIEGLEGGYDFLITNDFLEHIYNPSIVLQEAYKLIRDGGKMFVSVPNWRMGHTFIYRGLFDYDNWVYFMWTHGFEVEAVWNSPLVCPYSPKLSSESEMDDKLIQSWNWYFLTKKIG